MTPTPPGTARRPAERVSVPLVLAALIAAALVVAALAGCGSRAAGRTVRVPDVTGLDYAEAQTVLAGAKLNVALDARNLPGVKPLTVVSQKPAAKSEVPEGTRVTIVVASGGGTGGSGGSKPATRTP